MGFKSKIQYENPLDLLFYKIGDIISPIFYALNLTANHLTIIGLLLGLLSLYYLYVNNLLLFGILWMLSFFFDCIDGGYARKYKMVSEYGDMLDTVSDYIKIILLIFVVYKKYNFKEILNNKKGHVLIIVLLLINGYFQVGCLEAMNPTSIKNSKYILSHSNANKCLFKNKKYIDIFLRLGKYFGNGVLAAFIVVYAYYFKDFRL